MNKNFFYLFNENIDLPLFFFHLKKGFLYLLEGSQDLPLGLEHHHHHHLHPSIY